MQHLFTPGREAVLRLHALQQLQQLLLLLRPLTAHHVLLTAGAGRQKVKCISTTFLMKNIGKKKTATVGGGKSAQCFLHLSLFDLVDVPE